MAYSFTEPQNSNQGDDEDDDSENEEAAVTSAPMMVPVADILNHVTRNNAKLTFGKEALKMVTTRPIKKVCVYIFVNCIKYCIFFYISACR